MHNIPVVVGGTVGNVSGTGSGNYAHPRSTNPKLTPMQIRCKFGQLGPSKGQFNSPHGFCLGTDEDIIVADTNNHRIQVQLPFSFIEQLRNCSSSFQRSLIYFSYFSGFRKDRYVQISIRYSRKGGGSVMVPKKSCRYEKQRKIRCLRSG